MKAGALRGELALAIGVRFGKMLLRCRPSLRNGCLHAEETQVESEDARSKGHSNSTMLALSWSNVIWP